MKKILAIIPIFLLLGTMSSYAQIFWVENFESGSSAGKYVTDYTGPNGAWTLSVTGTEEANPNLWYVSCAEAGQPAGWCGAGCAGGIWGATLHVGSTPAFLGDVGANYDHGGLCGLSACPQTDRRAESPVINCTGKTNINLKFYYLENGDSTIDDGSVWYSADNGTTWSLLINTAKTPVCGSGEGTWALQNVALPVSANNNPTVKIGFRWVNNDDGAGADPSYGIDSMSLSTVVSTTGIANVGEASENLWLSQPNNSTIILNAAVPIDNELTITIYDATGRKIVDDTWNAGTVSKQISGLSFAPGMLIVKVNNSYTSTVLKLLRR